MVGVDSTLLGSVLGLDLSLTATGICKLLGNGEWESGTIRPPKTYRHGKRLAFIDTAVLDKLRLCDAVAIEGYAYAAKGRTYEIGELGGVIKLSLYFDVKPYTVVPPTVVKKFLTGKGNSGKIDMMRAVRDELGLSGLSLKDHNQVDAFVLSCIIAAKLGRDIPLKLTDGRRTLLRGVDAPTRR